MPRDGSGIYTKPFEDVEAGTTIESAVYNGFVNDVTIDLNAVRPIIAGGTGASNADEVLANFGAEKVAQLVTNYDAHIFFPGSFRSAAAATAAPTANAFAGICYINEPMAYPPTNLNIVLEARDLDDASVPGTLYVREKKAGVWGVWAATIGSAAEADAHNDERYVNVTGDTVAGPLTVTGTTTLGVVTAGAVNAASVAASGAMTAAGTITGGNLATAGAVTSGSVASGTFRSSYSGGHAVYYLGDGDRYINYVPSTNVIGFSGAVAYNFSTTVRSQGELYTGYGVATGTIRFGGVDSARYLHYDGANYSFSGGSVYGTFNGNIYGTLQSTGGTHSGHCGGTIGIGGTGTANIWQANAFDLGAAKRFADHDGVTWMNIHNIGGGNAIRLSAGQNAHTAEDHNFSNAAGTYWMGSINAGGFITEYVIQANSGALCNGYRGKNGRSGGYQGEWHNFWWNGGTTAFFVGDVAASYATPVCDYRIKKDVKPLPSMWDKVKSLRPISYTPKEFKSPSEVAADAKPVFADGDEVRWGFIAHELQDTLVPSAAFGEKDGPALQGPNPMAVIAALTSALQEAMKRIEALEKRK